MEHTIAFSRECGGVWSRHDAPIWSTRCAVPLQPRRRAARDPLFRREATRMRLRRAPPRPHATEITQLHRNGSTPIHGMEPRNLAVHLANPPTIPRGSIRRRGTCPRRRMLHRPDPAGRANRYLSSNLQVPRSKMPPQVQFISAGCQNDRYCSQFIDGGRSAYPAGLAAKSRQGFQPADHDPVRRHPRRRAAVRRLQPLRRRRRDRRARSRPTCPSCCCSWRC